MDNNLPQSWLDSPKYLTPCRNMENGDYPYLYWVPKEDNYAPVYGRISVNQSSAATMEFLTDFDSIADSEKQSILFRTILGGWDSFNETKNPPLEHPYFSNFFAHDIVGISPMGEPNPHVGGDAIYSDYDVAIVVVSYETLNYKVNDATEGGGPSINWIEPKWSGTNSRVTQFAGQYKFKDTSTTVSYGVQTKRPEGHFGLLVHNVNEDQIFDVGWTSTLTDGMLHGNNLATDITGRVNNEIFFGFREESVLLDSISVEHTWVDWDGKLNMDLMLNFIWLDWTWNKLPFPDGSGLQDVVNSKDNSTKPFLGDDFDALMSILNPAS